MPPKAKITKEMVLEAAFAVARETGADNINARTVAEKLGCSTQPVLYHFATIAELKRAVYAKTDWFHTEYLLRPAGPQEDPLLSIGLNYIRFAVREPHLFRLLFQSGLASENSLPAMVDSQELVPVLSAMQEGMGVGPQQTKEIFLTLALFVHGYASLLANNSLQYEEALIRHQLEKVYTGAVYAAQEESK